RRVGLAPNAACERIALSRWLTRPYVPDEVPGEPGAGEDSQHQAWVPIAAASYGVLASADITPVLERSLSGVTSFPTAGRHAVPAGWARRSPITGTARMSIRRGLVQVHRRELLSQVNLHGVDRVARANNPASSAGQETFDKSFVKAVRGGASSCRNARWTEGEGVDLDRPRLSAAKQERGWAWDGWTARWGASVAARAGKGRRRDGSSSGRARRSFSATSWTTRARKLRRRSEHRVALSPTCTLM